MIKALVIISALVEVSGWVVFSLAIAENKESFAFAASIAIGLVMSCIWLALYIELSKYLIRSRDKRAVIYYAGYSLLTISLHMLFQPHVGIYNEYGLPLHVVSFGLFTIIVFIALRLKAVSVNITNRST